MIDVMIITHNEAMNLPYCLEALEGWTNKIFVIDSGSTDGTQQIARDHGAQVIDHAWEGYARQKNWGLANLPWEAPWLLLVDADEVITPELRGQLEAIANRRAEQVSENGFFINRLTLFLGKPIRHCGYFPSWNMRLFKRGAGRYEDREVHEHVIIDNPVGYIDEPMLHNDRRGLEHFVAKHNRYSTLEARSIVREMKAGSGHSGEVVNVPAATRRRRWLKRHVMPYLPMTSAWRFFYMYIIKLGILDGRVGLEFCKFVSMYDYLLALKLRYLRRQVKLQPWRDMSELAPVEGLAVSEGDVGAAQARPETAALSAVATTPAQPAEASASAMQTQPEPSPWSFWEKAARAIWILVGRPLFRISFHNWHRARAMLLRLFGAQVGNGVAIRPTVQVEMPWNLEIQDDATVGDHAILYSLGKITIGKRSIVSQYSHLCAGTHDYTDHRFKLIPSPITIGDDVWIGADSFIGPGVNVGSLAVVGARSSAYKDLPAKQVCVGNPAKAIKERYLQ